MQHRLIRYCYILIVISLTLVLMYTNNKKINEEVGEIIIIWASSHGFILPYILNDEMYGGGGFSISDDKESKELRLIALFIASALCLWSLYRLSGM